MTKRTFFSTLALATLLTFPTGMLHAQSVSELEKVVENISCDKGMNHAILSVCVYDIATENPLFCHNSQLSMSPVSVDKLITTGVAFSTLCSDFIFTTRLGISGTIDREGVLHGNVYILGGGDPMLGSYRYRQTMPDTLFEGWRKALVDKGVRRVDGRVCYYTGIFDDQPLHDTWQWGDVGNYYGSGVSGLNFHENMYFVYFNPGAKLGFPATSVRVSPKNIDINATCEVTTGPEGSGDNVVIYGAPNDRNRLYRGTVPLGKKDFAVRGSLPSPARQCADLFATYLRSHGISVSSNSTQVYTEPDSVRVILDYYSSDFYTIAQYTNLTSNNLYAEAIFKYLGYVKHGKGSFANGVRAINEWLKSKRLDAGGVSIVDGSGLSSSNKVTADFLCRYLIAVSREPFSNDFYNTLSKAGESGTAKKIKLPAGVNVRLKTGTIDGVKAYAGYVDAGRGKQLAFAIISNGHELTAPAITERMNRILQKVASIY